MSPLFLYISLSAFIVIFSSPILTIQRFNGDLWWVLHQAFILDQSQFSKYLACDGIV